jgi:hypothetical protein
MQIHELTKRRKQRADEGLLSGLKDAYTAAKTGYQAAKDVTGGSTLAGVGKALGTLGQAAVDPAFAAQSSKEASSAAGVAKYNALAKKYKWEPMKDPNADNSAQADSGATQSAPADTAQAPAPTPEQIKQQAATMVQQFTQEPDFTDLTAVLPDPGQVLTVKTKNGGTAYKDESGQWFTNGEAGPMPANEKAKLYYEKLIDVDQYEQAPAPQAAPTSADTATGKNKQVKEAVGNKKVQSIVNKLIQKNRAAEVAAQKAAANPATATKVEKARQQVDKAASMTRKSAPNRKAKTNIVKNALMNYATAIIQGGGTAPEVNQAQPGAEQAQPGTNPAQGQQANPVQKQMAAKTVTTKVGIDGNKLATSIATDPQVKQAVTTMTKESRKPLTQRLAEAIQLLKEEQVYITKDIRVRTAGGDYVKRVSDQTWYDPKGVPIDPVKYADYVKKLDKTPQAQLRYQADAQKAAKGHSPGGTDTGAQQAAQQPPPPPPPPPQAPPAAAAPQPDPMDQALKQQKMAQWLRGQNVDSLNAQIKDTTNQLRNAQIFGTGQAEYLQQQLAQLIAMKV